MPIAFVTFTSSFVGQKQLKKSNIITTLDVIASCIIQMLNVLF
jgi:hypothetical protein